MNTERSQTRRTLLKMASFDAMLTGSEAKALRRAGASLTPFTPEESAAFWKAYIKKIDSDKKNKGGKPKSALSKSADVVGDYVATLPSVAATGIPVIGPAIGLANLAGSLGGLGIDPSRKDNKSTDALSLAPGVGQYRLSQRLRRVSDASDAAGKSGGSNLVAELLGKYTSGALTAGAGGYAGSKLLPKLVSRLAAMNGSTLSRTDMLGIRGAGAVAGAGLGFAAPTIAAALVAAIRRKRSKQEQIDNDTAGRAVAKYLIPGLADYDRFKRMGASSHYDEKQKKAAEDRSCARRSVLKGAIVR